MTKAVSTKYVPTVGNTGYCGASRPAAMPTKAVPRPKAMAYTLLTFTPIKVAA
ncbi:hypothetical protein D3C72_2185730 [compost metagenome]